MFKNIRTAVALSVTSAAWLGSTGRAHAEPEYEFLGYVRQHVAVKLEDSPEINLATGEELGGKGEVSMSRTTLRLEGHADFDWIEFVGIFRSDREFRTDYLQDLEDSAVASSFTPSPPAPAPIPAGLGDHFLDVYDRDELREAYVTFDVGPRINARLGKQQVVWGETDVLRVTDVVMGYDNRWRSILELENEELRKPLIMANVTVDFPKQNGALQLLYRPGWDDRDDAVNDADLHGGRWAPQPLKGVDSLFRAPENFDHSSGDTKEPNYGLRWSAELRQIYYSLMYYRGVNLDPIVNSIFNPYGDPPTAPLGAEIIYPMTETFGMTFNAYSTPLDTVIRGEFAYSPNTPYNIRGFETTFPLGPDGPPSIALATGTAGLGGVKEKATLKSMIGFDKNLRLQKWLKTNRDSLWSTQIFDQWLTNYDKDDDLIDLFGFGAPRKEHWTVLTSVLALNYRYDTINPSFTMVYDLSNKDAIFIPATDFSFGDHWRLKIEADIMLPHASRKPSDSPLETETNLFGTFANNSQLNVRLSYYF